MFSRTYFIAVKIHDKDGEVTGSSYRVRTVKSVRAPNLIGLHNSLIKDISEKTGVAQSELIVTNFYRV